jgi:Icc-related predicted phosphoesterase
MPDPAKKLRIAALADLHYKRTSTEVLREVFSAVSSQADVLLLCGDLTDWGTPEEAAALLVELQTVKIPIAAVLGNHDYEANRQDEIKSVLSAGGVHMLDGSGFELDSVGFAGTKGFAGGFGIRTLEPWGEHIIKGFVKEALDETQRLETALARLRTPKRVAVLHYAPIQATVEGEPPEIFAFLGSSRLEEPLNRFGVAAVFHGHAHHGTPEGRTSMGIPVYNVSLPLLRSLDPDRPPFRIVEIPLDPDDAPPKP